MSFGKSDPPPAPDYAGAAREQGAANRETAIASSRLNNPNVINPYGTQTWTEGGTEYDRAGYQAALDAWNSAPNTNTTNIGGGGSVPYTFTDETSLVGSGGSRGAMPTIDQFRTSSDVGRPTLTQTLNPAQQALLDQQNQTRGLLGGLGIQGATALQGVVGRGLDLSGAPQAGNTNLTAGVSAMRPTDFTTGAPALRSTDFTAGAPAVPQDYEGIRNRVFDAAMGRANEDYTKQTDISNSNLTASGIPVGSKAYADRQQMIERSRNDARGQAELSAGNAAAQAYGVDAARRAAAIGENQAMFGASDTARQRAIAEQQGMFGASQAARQQGISENAATQGAMDRQRQTAIGELLAQRQTPLNEINALMSGSQVSNPFAVPNAAQNSNIAPPPIFGAATAQQQANMQNYNANQAQQGQMMSGLFSLGSAAMGAPGFWGP